MEYWNNQSSASAQPTDGDVKYKLLENIVEEEIQIRTNQLVSHVNCDMPDYTSAVTTLIAIYNEGEFMPRRFT